MEFRYQYVVLMQQQNPKMYRRLRDSGELDRYVQLKAQEAHRLYQAILDEGPQPPTLMSKREAEERVKAMMFEFPDDMATAKQEEAKALFGAEPQQGFSVTKPLPVILLDNQPSTRDTLETWESWLAELQAMEDFQDKDLAIRLAKTIIARKKKRRG